MSLLGSIKNWPSILRCCLGGVRGIGQVLVLLSCLFAVGDWEWGETEGSSERKEWCRLMGVYFSGTSWE